MKRNFIYIGVLALLEISLVGAIGIWREYFWNAVQARDLHTFTVMLIYFAVAALIVCFASGYSQYLVNITALDLRTRLTVKAMKILKKDHIEGQEQRIQEDCKYYPLLYLNLVLGMLKSTLLLVVFACIIIHQLGYIYLLLPIGYTAMGTMIAAKIAKPLINLNYINQNVEAAFRKALNYIKKDHMQPYLHVITNNTNLFITTKKLAYFQSFYNQITVIIPYVMLFSIYFIGKITFGAFMQVASAVNAIIENLSYVINSFNDINNWLSCRKRLKELQVL